MNYSPDGETMHSAVEVDRLFANFFSLAKAAIRQNSVVAAGGAAAVNGPVIQRWNEEDAKLNELLRSTKQKVC